MNTSIHLPIMTQPQRPLVVSTSGPSTSQTQPSQQQSQAVRRRRKIFFKQKLMSVDTSMILRNRIPEEPGSTIILELIGHVVSVLRTPTPTHPVIELLVRGEGQEPGAPLRVEYWGGAKETKSNFSVLVGKLCRFIGTVTMHNPKSSECTFLAYWVVPDVSKSDLILYASELKKTAHFVSSKET